MHQSIVPQSKKMLALSLLTMLAFLLIVFVFRKMIVETLHKASTNHVDLSTLETDAVAIPHDQRIETFQRIRNIASKGDLDSMSQMLKQGFNVNQDLGNNTTALMLAAQHNQSRMVRLLVQHNAKIATQDVDGKNALIFAAEADNIDEVFYLLDHDKKLNVNTRYNISWSGGQFGRQTVKETLFHIAVNRGGLPLVRALVDRHADINARDSYNSTALTHAASAGDTDMVKFLISQHADVNAGSDTSHTPLAYARMNHLANIVQILEKAGATR